MDQNLSVNRLQQLQDRLLPLRTALLNHPLYQQIDRLQALHVFMEHHAFAVWDFMSLLKALQRRLTCVELPWRPVADPLASRMINEIVLAEESDEDGQGGYVSHYGLYHSAMTRCGANTASIDGFLGQLHQGRPVAAALDSASVPACAGQFVRRTFEIIDSGNLCAIAAAFTFGREDLLPDVFQRIVDKLNVAANGGLAVFQYYLQRHIGLDGDEHGPMANRLMMSLCGADADRWQLAEQTAMDCLAARRELWDGIYDAMRNNR